MMNSNHLSERMHELALRTQFSGAVLVSQSGETLLRAGYGYANIEHEVPNTPETGFRIGSITKTFTAFAVLMLHESKQFTIDDLVTAYLPDLPAYWSGIRIRHLLAHTSGLVHPWDLAAFAARTTIPATLDEIIEQLKPNKLLFDPGSAYHYSGLGYFLLARIIEITSGLTYQQFISQNIFSTLGMHRTGSDDCKRLIKNRASGYQLNQDNTENADWVYMPILTGGGNLCSTVDDLYRWHIGLSNHQLISMFSYKQMYTIRHGNYGYGWNIHKHGQRTELRHSGGVPGFASHLLRIPAQDMCIIVLSNLVRSHRNPKPVISVANHLLRALRA